MGLFTQFLLFLAILWVPTLQASERGPKHKVPPPCPILLQADSPYAQPPYVSRPNEVRSSDTGLGIMEAGLLKRYVTALESIISTKEPDQNAWTCNDGGCVAHSAQIYHALRELGFPVKVLEVNIQDVPGGYDHVYLSVSLSDGRTKWLEFGTYHHFLADDSLGAEHEIIIDPTYLQFLRGRKGLKDASGALLPETTPAEPELFVGTRRQAMSLFKNYQRHIAPADIIFGQGGRFQNAIVDGEAYAQVVYGFGVADGARRHVTQPFRRRR